MKKLTSFYLLLLLCSTLCSTAFATTPRIGDIGNNESAEKINQQNQQWRKAIDDFANADADTVISPYMQIISRLNNQRQRDLCSEEVTRVVNQAIKLNPSSLVAHSILFSCAAKQNKLKLRQQYTDTINGLISNLIDTKEATSIKNVIEIREMMEAPLLLQAMGYTVLDVNMITRYGGVYYQYHVIDAISSKVTTRYFSNLRFMKTLLSNPDVSDDTASQLMTKYYQQEKMPFAVTEKAGRELARGQYQKAQETLKTLDEYSMTKNVQLARIYLNTDQNEQLSSLQRALTLDAKSGFIPAAIVLAQIKTINPSNDSTNELEALLKSVDHFTKPGEGAFQLALTLKKNDNTRASSLPWFKNAAAQNHPKATLALAILYRQGTLVGIDDKKAFTLFKQAHSYGIAEAAIELALYHHRGSGFAPADHVKEIALLRGVAEQTNPDTTDINGAAAYLLGQRYENGIDVDKSSEQAFVWYQLAFEQGERKAANQIGILHETATIAAIDGKPDIEKAYSWYEKAGSKGDSNGFSNLARFHQFGLGRDISLSKAANYYVRAAETGSMVAYCKLADIMLKMEPRTEGKWPDTLSRARSLYLFGAKKEGKVCPRRLANLYQFELKDTTNALQWYEVAANNGDVAALKSLELIYFDGYMKKEFVQALSNFAKGSKLGMVKSTFYLGQLYHKGLGTKRDDQKALIHWKTALKQGFLPAEQAIGLLYLHGQDSVRDLQKAKQYFDAIAARSLDGTLDVAEWFFYGMGTPVNYRQALIYYQLAAKQDSATAMNHLGEMYRFGWGVELDYVKALSWYQQAHALGYDLATHNIGEMYYLGTGVTQDHVAARQWFSKGAAQEISHSQYYLGLMHQNGLGVPQDDQQANQWFYLAMDQRHQGAKFELGKQMIQGKGMVKNPGRGLLFITEAAEAGHKQAADYLRNVKGTTSDIH